MTYRIMGSVYNPKDLSNKRRKKTVNDGTDAIIPEVDNNNVKEHEDIKEYDDRN